MEIRNVRKLRERLFTNASSSVIEMAGTNLSEIHAQTLRIQRNLEAIERDSFEERCSLVHADLSGMRHLKIIEDFVFASCPNLRHVDFRSKFSEGDWAILFVQLRESRYHQCVRSVEAFRNWIGVFVELPNSHNC